ARRPATFWRVGRENAKNTKKTSGCSKLTDGELIGQRTSRPMNSTTIFNVGIRLKAYSRRLLFMYDDYPSSRFRCRTTSSIQSLPGRAYGRNVSMYPSRSL